jgi:HAMP domain-containing protein
VVFVLDSDDSPEQALPGQEYPDPPPSLIDGFLAPSADDRIYADQWGAFLSGYAPVLNGGGRYLVGLDMRADDVAAKFHELRRSGIISLVASLLFALLFGRLLARHLVRYIRILSDRCHAIAAGRLEAPLETRTGDELDQLVESFNTMSRQLHETRLTQQAAELALRRSRDELEVRVTERTRELTAANAQLRNEIAERQRLEESQRQTVDALQKALGNVRVLTGLLPICAQCKKIRNDQGYWTQVEEFVTQHSDAQFSHGLCPECAARLFPSHQQAGGDRDARTPAGAEP